MPDYRRASRTLVTYVLAVPVIIAVYAGALGGRLWAVFRPAVATFLGATVISSVYADEALKRAPATPMRAAAVLAVAIALVGPGMAPAPAIAGDDPAGAVITAARQYLGNPYRLGAEGPKHFDCSGLIYRVFADAGELPRVGGMRLLARGYMRWFVSRGQFAKNADDARPGDLVVWNQGEHIGIYLGDGKALSALVNPWGVRVHSLHGINMKISYFLLVNWKNGDGNGNDNGTGDGNGDGKGDGPPKDDEANKSGNDGKGNGNDGNGNDGAGEDGDGNAGNGNGGGGDSTGKGGKDDKVKEYGSARDNDGAGSDGKDEKEGDQNAPDDNNGGGDGQNPPADQPQGARSNRGYATGTLNMRNAADPQARIVGWVSRGTTFRIIGTGHSPSGWLWYQVETESGKQGWLFSYWVREL